jgi:peptidoglycan/LPS O-acetylase OafA/YrhL
MLRSRSTNGVLPGDEDAIRHRPRDRWLWARFSRPTSGGAYIPEIDGLRFVSIALVLIFHIGVLIGIDGGWYTSVVAPFGSARSIRPPDGLLATVVDRGAVGVMVFFAISGFVLALPFVQRRRRASDPRDLSRYYVRRLTRIEPPYIVAMLLLFGVARVVSGDPSIMSLAASLAYVHQVTFGIASPVNSPAWSLEVEVQWYAIVPFLSLLLLPGTVMQRRLTTLLLMVLALVFQLRVAGEAAHVFSFIAVWLQYFLVGWLLADITVTGKSPDPEKAWRWDLVSLVGWPLLLATWTGPLTAIASPLLIMALCAAALRGKRTGRILRMRPLVAIGTMCYSIYLLHYPIFLLTRRFIGFAPAGAFALRFTLYAGIVLPMTLVIAGAFFLLVERPCMDPTWVSKVVAFARSFPTRRAVGATVQEEAPS